MPVPDPRQQAVRMVDMFRGVETEIVLRLGADPVMPTAPPRRSS